MPTSGFRYAQVEGLHAPDLIKKVLIKVYKEDVELYSASSFSGCGKPISLRSLADWLESYMYEQNLFLSRFRIDVERGSDTLSKEFDVFYCPVRVDSEDLSYFVFDRFLSAPPSNHLPPEGDIILCKAHRDGPPPEMKVNVHGYESADNIRQRWAGSWPIPSISAIAYADGLWAYNVDVAAISKAAREGALAGYHREITSFTVSVGDVSKDFFVDRRGQRSWTKFEYRNRLNIPETAWVQMSDVAKYERKASSALLSDGTTRQYDSMFTETHECETGPLMNSDAKAMLPMYDSSEVYLHRDGSATRILFTSIEVQIEHNPTAPVQHKFTWEPVDQRPIYTPDGPVHVFAKPFNRAFR